MEALYALADTCAGLGDVSAVLAGKTKKAREQTKRWSKARDWYLKSVSTWHKIPNPAHISPNFFDVSDPQEIAHRAQLAARKARP